MADKRKPLLILGDAVSSGSGLGRITRDLAVRVHANLRDVYRLATLGYGGPGSSKYNFQQYYMEGMHSGEWVIPNLPQVWDDFAGNEHGIIMCIWDCSRLSWFSQPQQFNELLLAYPGLQQWLLKPNFEKWLYCPVDASGPNDRMTFPLMQTLFGFDRILAYGQFGEDVIRRTIGKYEAEKRDITNLPHGIDSQVFFELNRKNCRKMFLKHTGAAQLIGEAKPIQDDEVLIGICATNQARKDWPLAIEAVSILSRTHKIRLWCHTDILERHFSIPALLVDHLLVDKTVVSIGFITDERMAEAYSACDLTIGPGPEGFGYPIFESMFCGTPCITGNYGGAPKWMHMDGLLPEPIAYRYEGVYAQKRPVYLAQDFVNKIIPMIGKRMNHPGELDWQGNLWSKYEAWFRRGK